VQSSEQGPLHLILKTYSMFAFVPFRKLVTVIRPQIVTNSRVKLTSPLRYQKTTRTQDACFRHHQRRWRQLCNGHEPTCQMEHLRQQLKMIRSAHRTSTKQGLALTLLDIERRLLSAWRIASLLYFSQPHT
jgi:hypothetical protein